MNQTNILTCPVCRRKHGVEAPLEVLPNSNGRTWACSERHSFDRAAAGYLNLLPPSGKKIHGDNKEMIDSRRALLDSGLYAPLREKLTDLLAARMPDGAIIWDSGCGEGYYTAEVARIGANAHWTVYGSDLSKDALRNAAKRSPLLRLVAASSYALPAPANSCDAILCLFAPQATDEFHRLLKEDGLMIQAVPGERHLYGLKEAIYDTPYENTVNRLPPQGFEIADCIELKQTVTLTDHELIAHLFQMTPYAYRTSMAGTEKIHAMSTLKTELHFYLFVYQKVKT